MPTKQLFRLFLFLLPCSSLSAQWIEQPTIQTDTASARKASYGWEEGQQAPDVLLTDINGKAIRLYDLLERPTVINFWYINCAPCRDNSDYLRRFQKQYGLNVLTVSTQDQPSQMREFAEREDLHWVFVHDNSSRFGKPSFKERTGLSGKYPDYLLIGPDRRILRVVTSGKQMPRLGKALQQHFGVKLPEAEEH